MIFIYTIVSVLLISAVSLTGVFTLSLSTKNFKESSLFLVSFAVGGLFGDAFIHLLPEAFKSLNGSTVSILTISGILLFFVLEKFLRWQHCHNISCKEHSRSLRPVAIINLIGDFIHNFIDGALVAGSFLVSLPLGLTTALAVLLHEIPQEIGDFGILVHGGLSLKKALYLNFLTALSAIIGAILVLVIGANIEGLSLWLLPITAGGFIYIAGADLIPELHHETNTKNSIIQFSSIVLGILIMAVLKVFD